MATIAHTSRYLIAGLGVACLALLLAGCVGSGKPSAQVVDRSIRQTPAIIVQSQLPSDGRYRVQPGDTLYSIAFRFGWDWQALAIRNGIREPYVIHSGQTIHFDHQKNPTKIAPPVRTTAVSSGSAGNTGSSSTKPSGTGVPPAPSAPVVAVKGWLWPADGTLIGRFSSNGSLNKGIDIAGHLGQPVRAAADGLVVYAGSGLRGYGELIIIKHNGTYISAYGHNRRLLVNEKQQVKAGQVIAEMGSTDSDRVKLHFEIRRQGKPVDPLSYLPKR